MISLPPRSFSRSVTQILLRIFGAALLTALLSFTVAPANATSSVKEYRLHFYHTHTGERLDVVYRKGNTYIPSALKQLDEYLGDYRTGSVRHYDPRLFDLLHDLLSSVGEPDAEIDVICGYRTPRTNKFLRHHSHGVAEHSLHMQAMAIDFRIPSVDTSQLRDSALALHRGGVGYYKSSDFVHIDVGRVRRW